MDVLLVRNKSYDSEFVTIGELIYELKGTIHKVFTCELPWIDNEPNISCIPDGEYKVKRSYSRKFKKDLWQVLDVPNRSGIRIHIANFSYQLKGCIAPGNYIADIDKDGTLDVGDSGKALKSLDCNLPDEFNLKIIWV